MSRRAQPQARGALVAACIEEEADRSGMTVKITE
jgi:hypothetical protein